VRLFLADDQRDVRSALRLLLEQQGDMQVAGEAAGAAELLDRLPLAGCDVLLVDWDLPGLDACRLLAGLRRANPPVRVIALTTSPLSVPIVASVRKSDPPQRLLDAIRAADPAASGAR
jgi:DNA-binding NarL/FixJ family response regulator